MNLGKSLIILVLLFSVLGVFTFAESLAVVSADNSSPGGQTWIAYNESNVKMTDLTATIKVTLKNNANHVQYFKISQIYTGSLTNGTIKFVVTNHDGAVRMIDPVSPELGGDWGWPIQAGETKTVKFTVAATGLMGNEPSWIANAGAVDNTYWPLIPDMGLYTSWFMPNEIETLNPDLDLQFWCGTFTFRATNDASYRVHGIIRGPIIPTDSKLVFSDPKVTFQDKDITLNAKVAAWNINLAPNGDSGDHEDFVYTYEWPAGSGSSTGNGNNLFPVTTAKNATTVPTKTTGVPYGLLGIAVLIVGAGLGYAKFLR